MEAFFKIPCSYENNKAKVTKNILKDDIIGVVNVDDMITPLQYTKEPKLFADPIFLCINMTVNFNQDPILKTIGPENSPVLYNKDQLNSLKGTPVYDFITNHIEQLRSKVTNSIKLDEKNEDEKINKMNKILNLFFMFYSAIFSKGLVLEINGNSTLCYFPILNKIDSTMNNEEVNCKIEFKDNTFCIKASKNIPINSSLYLPYNFSPSYEINFIKFGVLPNNFDNIGIPLIFENNNINICKEMKDDDKIMWRRIRKNPKYSKLKEEAQELFKTNIKLLENNKTDNKIIKEYVNHILYLYKSNYPK